MTYNAACGMKDIFDFIFDGLLGLMIFPFCISEIVIIAVGINTTSF